MRLRALILAACCLGSFAKAAPSPSPTPTPAAKAASPQATLPEAIVELGRPEGLDAQIAAARERLHLEASLGEAEEGTSGGWWNLARRRRAEARLRRLRAAQQKLEQLLARRDKALIPLDKTRHSLP